MNFHLRLVPTSRFILCISAPVKKERNGTEKSNNERYGQRKKGIVLNEPSFLFFFFLPVTREKVGTLAYSAAADRRLKGRRAAFYFWPLNGALRAARRRSCRHAFSFISPAATYAEDKAPATPRSERPFVLHPHGACCRVHSLSAFSYLCNWPVILGSFLE